MLWAMESTAQHPRLDDWAVVCRFLPAGWEQAAREQGALRRARGIADAATLLRVLLVHLADGCSLQETAVRVRQAGWCTISSVALFKRLQAAEQWLRWMAERLWRARSKPASAGSYHIRAVDATTVQEPGSTGTDWRVHYVIDLTNLQCDHFELTDVHGGETFKRIPVASGDLMLGDRAYGTPQGVAHVASQGADVLVRIALHMMPLYSESGEKISLLRHVRGLKIGMVREGAARVQVDDQRIAGRWIAVKRSRQAAELARDRMRRTARRKQRSLSRRALAAADYVFIWTTAPLEALSAEEALALYRVRWQIELAFKRMKSIMGLGHLPKWAETSARAWIHGKLLIALLVERLLDAAETVSPWGYRLVATPQPLA
jgi:hypothetical protein